MSQKLKMGKYQHYKGNFYHVEGMATHSETEEQMVIYRPLYGEGNLWVRPYNMFIEKVDVNGQLQSRFTYINED